MSGLTLTEEFVLDWSAVTTALSQCGIQEPPAVLDIPLDRYPGGSAPTGHVASEALNLIAALRAPDQVVAVRSIAATGELERMCLARSNGAWVVASRSVDGLRVSRAADATQQIVTSIPRMPSLDLIGAVVSTAALVSVVDQAGLPSLSSRLRAIGFHGQDAERLSAALPVLGRRTSIVERRRRGGQLVENRRTLGVFDAVAGRFLTVTNSDGSTSVGHCTAARLAQAIDSLLASG